MSVRSVLVLFFFLAVFSSWGQASLDDWLLESGAPADALKKIEKLISRSKQDGVESQQNLQKMFHRVQRSVLRHYTPYSDFSSMFAEGKFDCLTATMLYAHMLESLSYRFDVIETNYHIFILAHTPEGKVLLEATDPIGGFISDPEAIAARTGDYQRIKPMAKAGHAYQYQCNLFQRVSMEQLGGLLQFNLAVKAYNQADWISCAASLTKAQERYDNPRIRELCDILVQTLVERKEIAAEVRNECLSRLQPLLATGQVISSLD